MCFSFVASVAAGATLSAAGVLTVKLARRRTELPLALLPLLFGVQQLTEGVVWWSLDHGAPTLNGASTFAYMLFSHVLWPVFVPFAFLCLEPVQWRRTVLSVCLGVGAVVACHGLLTVMRGPSSSHIVGRSIQYELPSWFIVALYLLATCIGAFFSSRSVIRALGVTALALALLTLWLYAAVFVSVWCFFSAVLTIVIFVYFLLSRQGSSRSRRPMLA